MVSVGLIRQLRLQSRLIVRTSKPATVDGRHEGTGRRAILCQGLHCVASSREKLAYRLVRVWMIYLSAVYDQDLIAKVWRFRRLNHQDHVGIVATPVHPTIRHHQHCGKHITSSEQYVREV